MRTLVSTIQVTLYTFTWLLSSAGLSPNDSIGVEKKDGKWYVLHKVEPKETLYSISKKYSVKPDDIKLANPELSEKLQIGQVLRVPYNKLSAIPSKAENISASTKIHVVQKKETLYSIAKKYKVSIEDIKKINNLNDAVIAEGQILNLPENAEMRKVSTQTILPENVMNTSDKKHLVLPKETLYGICKKYNLSIDQIKQANPQLQEGLREGMVLVIPDKEPEKKTDPVPQKKNDPDEVAVSVEEDEEEVTPVYKPRTEVKMIHEKGIALLMDSKSELPRFQALHRTASYGTIIMVKNNENDQQVFVRVVGKLEGEDNKVIIKISKKAFERLQGKEDKMSVTIAYIP
ncbi:MAG: LysM peptidoglycan-binding domain-containing protein [Cytophagaceae bacterium]|nr:LysM peptidoglycan-binding domain-containing protein [Cytophagaceae bacterium]MDW8456409.1 LysM peptidoglycan-binding domain-containing protein [Cytophagaceae bacterium]